MILMLTTEDGLDASLDVDIGTKTRPLLTPFKTSSYQSAGRGHHTWLFISHKLMINVRSPFYIYLGTCIDMSPQTDSISASNPATSS